jgi:hypothetical protein
MYLHDPGLTQFKDWKVTCINGKMRSEQLRAIKRPFAVTVLHGYQCFKAVKDCVDRKKLGLLVFVPSNDVPWFNGRNTQAVKALKPAIILPEQRVRMDWYEKHSAFTEWFPPACATDVFKPLKPTVMPQYDIAFAGTMARATKYGTRNRWVRGFKKNGFTSIVRSGVTQAEFNWVYNQGRIAFHMSQFSSEGKRPQGTAYRIFEVGGIGRPLLLDKTPAIARLFKEDVHFIGYKTKKPGGWLDCLKKVRYYLCEHLDEMEAIGAAMRQEILDKHTYHHRGQRLRQIVEARA